MIDLLLVAFFQVAAGDPPAQPAAEAPASTEAPTQPAPPPSNNTDSNKVRCVREIITGTRLSRHVCRTQADLQLQQEETARTMHALQRPQVLNGN